MTPEEIPANLREALLAAAVDGKLACAKGHKLAEQLNISVTLVGQAADALGLRIVTCQLGCF